MIYFYLVPMVALWVSILLSIYDERVSKYTQIYDTQDAVIAFVASFIPLVNILCPLSALADSKVRFHK